MENKYLTTSDYTMFTNNILDTKIAQKKLFHEFDLNKTIRTLATKEKRKTLATQAELKTKQDKIVKLQTCDISLFFIGQSYFNNDGAQLYLIFQPSYKTITNFSDLPLTISEWESKELSNQRFKPPCTASKHFSPKLIWNESKKKKN